METKFIMTEHAQKRCQQRGIPAKVVDFIVTHGKSVRTHQDRKFYINKKRLNKLKHSNKAFFIKFDKFLLNTAVVCDDSSKKIITAMKIKGSVKWN